MKNKHIGVLLLTLILIIVSCGAFILVGSRGFIFRVLSMSSFLMVIINGIYFHKQISLKMQRGKLARLKIIEGCSILFLGISLIILVQSFDLNIDWTSKQLFHLSKETKSMLYKLDKNLTITIFSYPEKGNTGSINYAKKLAEKYRASNPKKIYIKYIDPIKDKIVADQYGIRQNGTIVFELDARREYVFADLLIDSVEGEELSFKGETIFSAIINKLLQNKEIVIYYLTGHGETEFTSKGAAGFDHVKILFTDRRYGFKALNLDHHPFVPKDADILIVSDPKTQLSAQTYQSIENYIDSNGSMLYMVSNKTIDDINVLLLKSGFAYLPNIAVDPSRTSQNHGEFSIIPLLSPKSEITKSLRRNSSVLFPSASGVETITQEYLDKDLLYDVNSLAKISQNGFTQRFVKNKQASNGITKGIQNLGLSSIIANKKNPKAQRRAVLLGSINFIDNSRVLLGGNAQFFLNAVDFLLLKDLNTTVPPKIQDLTLSIPKPEEQRGLLVMVLIWQILSIFWCISRLIKRSILVKQVKKS